MRFMRTGPSGQEIPVLLTEDGRHQDLRGITDDIHGAFLAQGGPGRVREAHAEGSLPRSSRCHRPPRQGAHCPARRGPVHRTQLRRPSRRVGFTPAPAPPRLLQGAPHRRRPARRPAPPSRFPQTDWEAELAVVIGRRARYLDSPEQALDHIAGYALSNDVSKRELQLELSGGQWVKGKSCETFNPLGPWLVTPDEIPGPQALGIRSWVNGEPRQGSTTGDMIFDVATLIHRLSQFTVLEPGDVINTGTPEGVALSPTSPKATYSRSRSTASADSPRKRYAHDYPALARSH